MAFKWPGGISISYKNSPTLFKNIKLSNCSEDFQLHSKENNSEDTYVSRIKKQLQTYYAQFFFDWDLVSVTNEKVLQLKVTNENNLVQH